MSPEHGFGPFFGGSFLAVRRFSIDVDPEGLRKAARTLKAMAEEAAELGAKVSHEPDEIGDRWTGQAATSAKAEMRGLGKHLKKFVGRLADSRAAAERLAGVYEDALRQVESLNGRWEAVQRAYEKAAATAHRRIDSAQDRSSFLWRAGFLLPPDVVEVLEADRTAERRRLVQEFDELHAELRRETRRCSKELSERVPLRVLPKEVARYRKDGTYRVGVRTDFSRTMPLSAALDLREERKVYDVSPPNLFGVASMAEEIRGGVVRAPGHYLSKADAAVGAADDALVRYLRHVGENPVQASSAFREFAGSVDEVGSYTAKAVAWSPSTKLGATVLKNMPLVGLGITAAGVGWDIHKGAPVKRTVTAAAVATGVGMVTVAVVGGPVFVSAGAAIALSWGAGEAVKFLWHQENHAKATTWVKSLF